MKFIKACYKCSLFLFLIIISSNSFAFNGEYNAKIENYSSKFQNRNEQWIHFNFPKDCKEFEKFIDQEDLYSRATQSTFNEIIQMSNLCYYSNLKTLGKSEATNDFVSNYDFMNGKLDDFPYNIHCIGVLSQEFSDICDRLKSANSDYSYLEFATIKEKDMYLLLPKNEEDKKRVKSIRSLPRDTNCKLVNGQFTGRIEIDNNIIRCISDEGEGFKIYRVAFRDVNNDDFLDAIVGIALTGGGSAYSGGYFVLTRKSAETKFTEIEINK